MHSLLPIQYVETGHLRGGLRLKVYKPQLWQFLKNRPLEDNISKPFNLIDIQFKCYDTDFWVDPVKYFQSFNSSKLMFWRYSSNIYYIYFYRLAISDWSSLSIRVSAIEFIERTEFFSAQLFTFKLKQ